MDPKLKTWRIILRTAIGVLLFAWVFSLYAESKLVVGNSQWTLVWGGLEIEVVAGPGADSAPRFLFRTTGLSITPLARGDRWAWDGHETRFGLRLPEIGVSRPMVPPGTAIWSRYYLLCPLWLPLGVVAAVSIWMRRRRHRAGCCETCGYDLTGNLSGQCPECGTRVAGFVRPPGEH